jgi:hypothetical protein
MCLDNLVLCRQRISGQLQNRLWGASSQCSNATSQSSRTFCAGLEKLRGELASAEESEALRAKDGELATKLAGMNLAEALKSADPQSEALARMTGFAPSSIKDGLAILVALLIELGSGFGLYAATAGGALEKAPERSREHSDNAPAPERESSLQRSKPP